MRAVWCGFALGVMGLQQQAALPGVCGVWWLLALAGVALGGAAWGMWGGSGGSRWRVRGGWCALGCAAFCSGFGYAAWQAHARLALSLPVAWEGREIEVIGAIKGLPTRDAKGVRFLFEVEATSARLAHFPQILQLSWLTPALVQGLAQTPASASATATATVPPELVPGERWRLPVRLKRPHGNANFGVREVEAVWLARAIRARGYVSAPQLAQRLPGMAGGVGMQVNRWRAALRTRIDTALAQAPQRGIVTALALGAQDAINQTDWQVLRATGTSHLVAISGMHIGIVAGWAGWLAGGLWRGLARVRFNGALFMPAPIVAWLAGVLLAAAYAALAGLNVPAQRALWMLSVAALARLSGRQLPVSVVLAWALGLVLLLDPWAVVSAGFWLSFGAVAAILFALSGRPAVRDLARDSEGEQDVMRRDGIVRDLAHDNARPGLASDAARGAHDSAEAKAEAEAGQPGAAEGGGHGRGGLHVPTRRRGRRAWARAAWMGWCAAGRRCRTHLQRAALVQFAVTLALAPLTVVWFSQIPLLGVLANAFAIPWVSLLVTPMVLLGVVLPAPLDAALWQGAHFLLAVLMRCLQFVAGPTGTLWRLPQPDRWALAAALAGVVWCLAPRGWPLRWAAPLAWLPLLWPMTTAPAPGTFRLTALDIGQGSSILVETARHRLLFDAGPGPESTHAGERIVVPFLQAQGMHTLDTLLISHADSDHSGGAPAVLESIKVRQLLAALVPGNPLWAEARSRGADTVPCAAGQRWHWDGVDFTLLWPDPGPLQGRPNAHSCVLRISIAHAAHATGPAKAPGMRVRAAPGMAALLTADIEAAAERRLLERDPQALQAQVLLVPHHGSKTSSTEPFLDAIDPQLAVFQVGYRSRFHHPHPSVWARYQARQIELTRSDEDGAARIDVTRAGLVLERYRSMHRRYWMDP
ncbi:DNA internalization-related competence protein ComEC/Rec2 [Paraburkholderia hayleyella]|uniref:DNA internalization-related competence protein ComEC/Rec2 n=1 Tax=Paraburkholderia hayleyella TaxID=2152889 RepID=UPI001290ADFD|nr:DNA internalization-related competence protein ComEC/Rec2 [Paraburkholderia hayleyella]